MASANVKSSSAFITTRHSSVVVAFNPTASVIAITRTLITKRSAAGDKMVSQSSKANSKAGNKKQQQASMGTSQEIVESV